MSELIKVAVDIDGVACAHAHAICTQVNKDFGLSSSANDVLSWDHDFGPMTFVEAVQKYYPVDGFVLNMKPTPGFKDFLEEITPFSIVTFATTRNHANIDTVAWVKMHFGDAYDLEFVPSKSVLDAHVVIDDNIKEIASVAERGTTAILYTQPWNDNQKTDEILRDFVRARRVRSFQELTAILRGRW